MFVVVHDNGILKNNGRVSRFTLSILYSFQQRIINKILKKTNVIVIHAISYPY